MKIARLVVASAAAVSLTFAGTGIAQAQTDAEQTTTSEVGALSSQLSSDESTEPTDKEETPKDPKPTDPNAELSSQLVASQAGPFAPLLLAVLPSISALLNLIDQLFEGLSFVPGLLNSK